MDRRQEILNEIRYGGPGSPDRNEIDNYILRIKRLLPGIIISTTRYLNPIPITINDELIAKILAYYLFKRIDRPLERQWAHRPGFDRPPNVDITNALDAIHFGGRHDRYDFFSHDGGVRRGGDFIEVARGELNRYNQEQLELARGRLQMAVGTRELANINTGVDDTIMGEDVSNRILNHLNQIPIDEINNTLTQRKNLDTAQQRLRLATLANRVSFSDIPAQRFPLGREINDGILHHLSMMRQEPYIHGGPQLSLSGHYGQFPGYPQENPSSSSSSSRSSSSSSELDFKTPGYRGKGGRGSKGKKRTNRKKRK